MAVAALLEPGRELAEARLEVWSTRDAMKPRPFVAERPDGFLAVGLLIHPLSIAVELLIRVSGLHPLYGQCISIRPR